MFLTQICTCFVLSVFNLFFYNIGEQDKECKTIEGYCYKLEVPYTLSKIVLKVI